MSSEQSEAGRTETPHDIDPHDAFPRSTRTGFVWAATIAVLLLLTVMIIFILQNQVRVWVNFLGWTGVLPLGVALLIAVVAGGAMVALGGAARIAQLRRQQRKVAKRIRVASAPVTKVASAPVTKPDTSPPAVKPAAQNPVRETPPK